MLIVDEEDAVDTADFIADCAGKQKTGGRKKKKKRKNPRAMT